MYMKMKMTVTVRVMADGIRQGGEANFTIPAGNNDLNNIFETISVVLGNLIEVKVSFVTSYYDKLSILRRQS